MPRDGCGKLIDAFSSRSSGNDSLSTNGCPSFACISLCEIYKIVPERRAAPHGAPGALLKRLPYFRTRQVVFHSRRILPGIRQHLAVARDQSHASHHSGQTSLPILSGPIHPMRRGDSPMPAWKGSPNAKKPLPGARASKTGRHRSPERRWPAAEEAGKAVLFSRKACFSFRCNSPESRVYAAN